jgi:hypothetical protein
MAARLTKDVTTPSAGPGMLAEGCRIYLQDCERLAALAIIFKGQIHLTEIAAFLLLACHFSQTVDRCADLQVE